MHTLKIEKIIAREAKDVFKSLQEGKLFMNCSADSNSIKLDFRVGGKYNIDFKNHKVSNWGEFLEIIPNQKIVFSWCQTFGPEQKPDTKVTIELFPEGAKTRLVLAHTGFEEKASCDNHYQGWNGGLNDLASEMESGRIRIVRRYETSIENLYDTVKRPENFFGFMGDLSKGTVDFKVGGKYQVPTEKGEVKGEFLEIIPNKKITLTWLGGCGGPLEGSKVTLNFNLNDNKVPVLEILHEGLTDQAVAVHRQGWDHVTTKMMELFSVGGVTSCHE